ncbi:glycoside hydrolase domain-containing protein [Nocardioides sp. Leaf285]|uniref:glycoside hydrolase domain-containing protein n=1 Tax=Nocardioides sp. Leaf285 TaxID=1736322 RepID=UPI000702C89C|nr:glycoside hydrolase domain-containing protein [Nocardioides sp. Leaf285]KQP65573.1 hypothetical protein ASF47_07340 [Nocardioides sp. Leaf285]
MTRIQPAGSYDELSFPQPWSTAMTRPAPLSPASTTAAGRPARRRRTLVSSALTGVLALGALAAVTGVAGSAGPGAERADAASLTSSTTAAAARREGEVVVPGDFTGYGFDQCLAPTQETMNTWWRTSPFSAVGIYISGDSRACRSQPNLTPAWISTQVRKGWRLLPITLGPQASCQPRFPRYSDDRTINPSPGTQGTYVPALKMGRQEATSSVADAAALGIGAGSTLWYDLEGYNSADTHCRESALSFLSGWTQRLHALGYVSGVYSSAGSGIADLDKARINRPDRFTLPDRIWIARWDGVADTSTSYIREDGWRPGGRVKQYRGGHDEVWGGARINIDSNWLDLGKGSTAAPEEHCGGARVNWPDYVPLQAPVTKNGRTTTSPATQVTALQCLLKEAGVYSGKLNGVYNDKLTAAVRTWQGRTGAKVTGSWYRDSWMTLHAAGSRPVLKTGSAGPAVRRVQRALNAASPDTRVVVTGVFAAPTERAVKAWQQRTGQQASGVVNVATWRKLAAGARG